MSASGFGGAGRYACLQTTALILYGHAASDNWHPAGLSPLAVSNRAADRMLLPPHPD